MVAECGTVHFVCSLSACPLPTTDCPWAIAPITTGGPISSEKWCWRAVWAGCCPVKVRGRMFERVLRKAGSGNGRWFGFGRISALFAAYANAPDLLLFYHSTEMAAVVMPAPTEQRISLSPGSRLSSTSISAIGMLALEVLPTRSTLR